MNGLNQRRSLAGGNPQRIKPETESELVIGPFFQNMQVGKGMDDVKDGYRRRTLEGKIFAYSHVERTLHELLGDI